MQRLISQIPQLSILLANIHKNNHFAVIKHLIQQGIQATRPNIGKENKENSNLQEQIMRIKNSLSELNQIVRHPCSHCCQTYNDYAPERNTVVDRDVPYKDTRKFNTQQISSKGYSFAPKKGNNQSPFNEPAVRDIMPVIGNFVASQIQNKETSNPFSKNKTNGFRHHLDDTSMRESLHFANVNQNENNPSIKRKSQDYKKHIYQEQINKEEQVRLKEQRGHSGESERRNRTVSDYTNTQSKIKPLVDKHRLRYIQQQKEEQFKEGFNKYEYSDQNQMQEESSIEEQAQPSHRTQQERNTYSKNVQSSFKKSNQTSNNKSQKSKASSKKDKEAEVSKKDVSSKLQVSNGETQGKIKSHGKQSNHSKGSSNKGRQSNQRGSDKYNFVEEQEQQSQSNDLISNSSSFSQFSINGSRRRDVGKISRKSDN